MFQSNLAPGMSGPQVKLLQQWLNQHGFPVAPAGQPGSYGMETDYFGPSTQTALQSFQASNGLGQMGSPGTLDASTVAAINSYTGGTSGASSSTQSDPSVIQARYGYEVNNAAENRAVSALDGFLNVLKTGAAGSTPISSAEYNRIVNDSTLMSRYINALTYGGYSLQDVYQEMLKQSYQDSGQGSLVQGPEPISDTVEAPTYKASADYQSVANNTKYNVSPTIAGLDSSVLTLPVFQMPDSAFQALTPMSDPNSAEFRLEMEKYKDATYEAALQISQAQNDVDHQKALANWQTAKQQIEDKLGIQLSGNAVSAWNQINSYQQQAAEHGIAGSGIEAQQIDQYLKQQMSTMNTARKSVQNSEDASKQTYYQNYASPAEIASLIATDPVKAQEWGLVAPDNIKQYLTVDNLQKLFPGTPVSDLQQIIGKYLDPNGNLYSQLYSNYAATNATTLDNEHADEGNKVIAKASADAKSALAQYSDPSNPFLRPDGSILKTQASTKGDTSTELTKAQGTTPTTPATPVPASNTSSAAAAAAAAKASQALATSPVTTGSTSKPNVTLSTSGVVPGAKTTPATGAASGLSIGANGQVMFNGMPTLASGSGTGSPLLSGNATGNYNTANPSINFGALGSAIKSGVGAIGNWFAKTF